MSTMLNETWLAVKVDCEIHYRSFKGHGISNIAWLPEEDIGSISVRKRCVCFCANRSWEKFDFRASAVCIWLFEWRSSEQRSFVAASFFRSITTIFGTCKPFYGRCPAFFSWLQWTSSIIRSFLLPQESSELLFRFCLRNFGTKCLSKVNLRHWIPPFRWSTQDLNTLWSFLCLPISSIFV